MSHHHGHSHDHGPQNYNRVFAICMVINGAYGLAQLYVGWRQAQSMALVTDAAHNLSDVASLGIPWIALVLAARPASARFTYGLGKGTIAAAALSFIALMGFMVWAIIESTIRIWHPPEVSGAIMTWMALIGIVVNLTSVILLKQNSSRAGGAESKSEKVDLNIKAAYQHQAVDLVSSVAVVIAGLIVVATDWSRIDPIITIVVSLAIIRMIWRDTYESLMLLGGATPAEINGREIESYLLGIPGVSDAHLLRLSAVSTTSTDMSVHLIFDSWDRYDELIDTIRLDVTEKFGIGHLTVQPELENDGLCPHIGQLYSISAPSECHHDHAH